jgi:DNA-binding FadR family transcriptional regulator
MDSPSFTAVPTTRSKHRTLAQGVVEDISRRIRDLQIKPGDKLPTEASIMAAYGVSRTVVREAISQLQAAGVVQTRHGIGTFVLDRAPAGLKIEPVSILTMRDVLAILELRISVEAEAAALAASRRSEEQALQLGEALDAMRSAPGRDQASVEADVRFHTLIAQATGNPYFVQILSQLGNTLIPRARLDTPALEHDRPADYLERVNREHEDIYRAVLFRDPEAARSAMRTHLTNSRERLQQARQRLESITE